MKNLSDTTKAAIGRLIQDAQQRDASDNRGDLFDRYMGEPYGDEVKGRSAFISTDVADAVEAILPDLMDVFTATEEIVTFAPVGPDDEEAAKQETAAVSHMFWEKNPGFENLYVWIKEALIQQNSYIKRGWEKKVRSEVEEYADLTADEVISIMQDAGDAEIMEVTGGETEFGEWEPATLKIRRVTKEDRYCIECIPQEEFFITPRWGKVGLDGVPCCGHRRKMEFADLVAMGFDEDSIEAASDARADFSQTDERFDTEDSFETERNDGDKATKRVEVFETYCRVDFNNDGIVELVRVWAIGNGSTILKRDGKDAVDEVSCVPFSALTPYIVPHRHMGRSAAELVDDIQKIKTVLLRHTLDNLYLTNYQRPYFDEGMAGPHLVNDLVNPAPGAPIRTGGADVLWQTPGSIIDTTLPLLGVMDDLKETRTGATRYNQGLDADSLNKTATGIQKIMNASQKKTLLIARTIAETGLRDLFMGIHRDLRKGPVRELVMKLTGGWAKMNPRQWRDRTDVTVKVGMGHADRDQTRQGLMLMGQVQQQLMAGGSRMVDEARLYETAQRVMATYGFKTVEPFLNDPAKLPPAPPPPPDPQMLMAQKQMEIMENESKSRIQLDAMKAQAEDDRKRLELSIRMQAEQRQAAKTASDIMTDQERLDLDRNRAVMEDDYKRDKLEVDALTGAMRASPMQTTSEPPVDYGDV